MKNAILLHGKPGREEYYSEKFPSASNSHWIPWLQKQLLLKNISVTTPEMFRAYEPQYVIWKQEFERYEITRETILVGHSCGGGFLVRWLSENPSVYVDTVVLVAPWIDPDEELDSDFFNFTIDPSIFSRCSKFLVMHSKDDDEDIHKTVLLLKETFPELPIREFENHGHFTFRDMGTVEFPELLQELV